MKSIKNIIAAILMVTTLSVTTAFADGIIVGNRDGIIVGNRGGIIVGNGSDKEPCTNKEGIIVGNIVAALGGIIVGNFAGGIIVGNGIDNSGDTCGIIVGN